MKSHLSLRILLLLVLLGLALPAAAAPAATNCAAQLQHTQSMLRILGKRYLLNTDKLYTYASAGHGYDVMPVWQQQHVTVTGVISLGSRRQWRIWLRTDDGQEGYLDVYNAKEVARFLRPATKAVA